MKKIAQSILDYVILLLVVITALMVMGHYVRNSLSGRIREGADTIGQGRIYSNESTQINGNIIENIDNSTPPEENLSLEECLAGSDTECNQRLAEGIAYCCVECCGTVEAACNASPTDGGLCNPGSTNPNVVGHGCRNSNITNCQESGEEQRDICCETKYGNG
jgi:hypothetical protein